MAALAADLGVGRTTTERRLISEWSLPDLVGLFPDLRPPASGAARCSVRSVGRGKYIKQVAAGPQFGDVALEGDPAERFSVYLHHAWPSTVPADVVARLNQALLRGILEAALREDPAALGCRVTTTAVVYQQDTTEQGTRIAASMAFQDMARKTEWTPRSPLGPKVA
jgi:hypothetical protein